MAKPCLVLKTLFCVISLSLFMCGCSESTPLSKKQMAAARTFAEVRLHDIDSALKLDSFRFVRQDTLFEKDRLYAAAREVRRKQDYLRMEEDAATERANRAQLQWKLSGTETERAVYRELLEKALEASNNSLQNLKAEDSLTKLADGYPEKQHPLATVARFIAQVSQRDGRTQRDTMGIVFDQHKNLIYESDFVKLRAD